MPKTQTAFETRMVPKAYRVALDPTPRQERMLASHAGGARFAYNWGLDRIQKALEAQKEDPDVKIPGHFDLCKQWTQWKDTAEWVDHDTGEAIQGVPWVANNFSGTYQAALRDADKAWKDYFASRTGQRKGKSLGKPRFKSKRHSRPRFQTHGGIRLASATKLVLPVIGTVTVMSDDSHHPAMARSRSHTPGQRHMGNRRRSDHLHRKIVHGAQLTLRAVDILARAHHNPGVDVDVDTVLQTLNRLADEHARADAVTKRTEQLQKAEQALTKTHKVLAEAIEAASQADDEAAQAQRTGKRVASTTKRAEKARQKVDYLLEKAAKASARVDTARDRLTRARNITADRKNSWSPAKLTQAVTTGRLDPTQARDLATAYGLSAEETEQLVEAAHQPRITRVSISQGPDGLWWASLGCEIPEQVRVRPSRRQAQRGSVGVDLGVFYTATLSQRLGGRRDIANPTPLENARDELRRAQQQLSRCQAGSNRYAKAKARVGLIHADVARLRRAHLDRVSTRLVKTFERIAFEGHNLQELAQRGSPDVPRAIRRMRNRRLVDTSAGTLRVLLKEKAARFGSTVVETQAGTPTGRTCAVCGEVKAKPVPLWHAKFTCQGCGRSLPRRLNTAMLVERSTTNSDPPEGGSG